MSKIDFLSSLGYEIQILPNWVGGHKCMMVSKPSKRVEFYKSEDLPAEELAELILDEMEKKK